MNIRNVYDRASKPVKVCLLFVAGCFLVVACELFMTIVSLAHPLLIVVILIIMAAVLLVYYDDILALSKGE